MNEDTLEVGMVIFKNCSVIANLVDEYKVILSILYSSGFSKTISGSLGLALPIPFLESAHICVKAYWATDIFLSALIKEKDVVGSVV